MRIEAARPAVITSLKNHTPKRVTTTPLTADETICVMGDVTLMLKKPAMQMRKPNRPVTIVPHKKVFHPFSSTNNNECTAGPSPTRNTRGNNTIVLNKLLYHANAIVLPPTKSNECLMITAEEAVVNEERRPKMMPRELEYQCATDGGVEGMVEAGMTAVL